MIVKSKNLNFEIISNFNFLESKNIYFVRKKSNGRSILYLTEEEKKNTRKYLFNLCLRAYQMRCYHQFFAVFDETFYFSQQSLAF